jgi:hypothetical protein
MDWSDEGHKGIKKLVQVCCIRAGLVYWNNPPHIVYANQFICKKKIYDSYLKQVIIPSLDLLEGELWDIANKPAGYTAGLSSAELKKHTGLRYYNFIPFVLERLMMQYIWNKRIKCIDVN